VHSLVGATPETLRAMLGPPLLLRREGLAQVWLYRSSVCAIDLILYPDSHSGAARVALAEERSFGVPASGTACLTSVSARRGAPGGPLAAGAL